jgi:hypothetical protein
MKQFQFSVLGIVVLVTVTAIGLAALASPTVESANGLFTFVGGSMRG